MAGRNRTPPPPPRLYLVEAVRERLAAGYYEGPAVLEATSQALLNRQRC